MQHPAYRVIGIDPGYDRLGVAIIEKNKTAEKLIFSTCLTSNKKDAWEKRLLSLGQELEKIIRKYQPDTLAMERLFVTVNQKTAMAVAEVRGMILFLAGKYKLATTDYTPMEVKSCLTGYGHADKKQMMSLVERIIKIDSKKKMLDDEYDAIAIALTHLAHQRFI
ncbi:MAG: crossover junction endodeoxyribonuclease RuvC [Candidatus Vogelbacteria bacterium RIFOXYD2_FULL_44_9]|uniref:Crossover junction endodeoxyribonuclease RuvC n=1 Tax=Candidatus Vogelbacteria bacterium RIFOXYD2_FULL_44_9 TaxID=1802441 RepID=A0A1G2QIL9_9BACT|nr:MAG: crossover junction endodeoxyribonuclease RuvC [Candidatus Vogelbacteria bacterium RIFOXYD2_FULL_44_9]